LIFTDYPIKLIPYDMLKIEIQGSGFPATNLTWRFLRDMINQVHNLTALGGDTYILSGCTNNGADIISNGFIVYQGELLPFTGGALGAQVTIVETIEQTTYLEDLNNDGQGDLKDTYFTRTAQFGNTGTVTFNWSDLKAVKPLLQQSTPVGGIIMWSGAINEIPEGWKLCDGDMGTPNLSGRFIVGYNASDVDYNAIGKVGGAKEVTLLESQMPTHNHNGTTQLAGGHSHRLKDGAGGDKTNSITLGGGNLSGQDYPTSFVSNDSIIEPVSNHSHSLTTNNKGGSTAHENRPQYFTLAYIIFVGV